MASTFTAWLRSPAAREYFFSQFLLGFDLLATDGMKAHIFGVPSVLLNVLAEAILTNPLEYQTIGYFRIGRKLGSSVSSLGRLGQQG